MAKRKSIPLILGVVFNPEHPAVAKLLAEHGINTSSLTSAGMGAVVQIPSVVPADEPSLDTKPKRRRFERAEHRGTPLEHAELILDAFTDPNVALSVSEVVEATGLSMPQARRGLNALRENGQVFMGGDKRFARYGLTPEVAKAAAVKGRNIQESIQLYRPIRPRSKIVPEEGPGI